MGSRAPAELAADPLVRLLVDDYLPRIRRSRGPVDVWLFGSRVRDDWMEESDLDVILVSERFAEAWPERIAALIREIRLVDPIQFFCYTPDEFGRKRLELGFLREAMTEAVPVRAASA